MSFTTTMYKQHTRIMALLHGFGWASVWGEWTGTGVKISPMMGIDDRLWCSGMYGIMLGSRLEEEQTITAELDELVEAFVRGHERVVERTGGIYLRNNTDDYIAGWEAGDMSAEASKDQVLGMFTGLYAVYRSDRNADRKLRIYRLIKAFDAHLARHGWQLFNEKSNRPYWGNGGQVFLHYRGLSRMLGKVLGFCHARSFIGWIIAQLTGLALKAKADLIAYTTGQVTGFMRTWWAKLIAAKQPSWVDPAEYSINLYFYELYLEAYTSKRGAKRVAKLLAHENVRRLKHLNLAALYLGLPEAYRTNEATAYYRHVLGRDIVIFPWEILPNSAGLDCIYPVNDCGDGWRIDTVCHRSPDRRATLDFPEWWDARPAKTGKTPEDIPAGAQVDCGMMYLMRRGLSKFYYL